MKKSDPIDTWRKFHGPYHIFIQTDESKPEKIVELVMPEGSLLESTEEFQENYFFSNRLRGDYVYGIRHGEWLHLLETWSYSLWHSEEHQKKLVELKKNLNVITLFVGDADTSYGFSVDIEGKPNREVFFEDDLMSKTFEKNIGTPYSFECHPPDKEKDEGAYVIGIPEHFGIDLNITAPSVNVFRVPNPIRHEDNSDELDKKPWWKFW